MRDLRVKISTDDLGNGNQTDLGTLGISRYLGRMDGRGESEGLKKVGFDRTEQ